MIYDYFCLKITDLKKGKVTYYYNVPYHESLRNMSKVDHWIYLYNFFKDINGKDNVCVTDDALNADDDEIIEQDVAKDKKGQQQKSM